MENPRNQGFPNLVPTTNEVVGRAEKWKNLEEKYEHITECEDVFFEFDEDYTEEENSSDAESSVVVEEVEKEDVSTALAEYWEPKKFFNEKLLHIIQQQKVELYQRVSKMEFGVKVSQWLSNNDAFLGTSGAFGSGRSFRPSDAFAFGNGTSFRPSDAFGSGASCRSHFRQEMDLEFENCSGSSASVNSAPYNMANGKKTIRRKSIQVMTIREYCILEQNEDLELERGPFGPIGDPYRPLAIEPLPPMPPAIEAPQPKLRDIEAAQPKLRDIEAPPPKPQASRTKSQQKKAKRPRKSINYIPNDSEESLDDEGDRDYGRKVPQAKRPPPPKVKETKKPPEKPKEIVIHNSQGKDSREKFQITFKLLKEKIGLEKAKKFKEHHYLKNPISVTTTIVYSPEKDSLYETFLISSDSSDEESEEDCCGNMVNREVVEPPSDIVIYSPMGADKGSHKTMRIKPEMLRGKIHEDVIKQLKDSPIFQLDFPIRQKLMYNPRTRKIYIKV